MRQKLSNTAPKYAMVYSWRIFRTDDASVVAEGFRGFRADSLGTIFAMFKSRVAREKAPKEKAEPTRLGNSPEEKLYDEITDEVPTQVA